MLEARNRPGGRVEQTRSPTAGSSSSAARWSGPFHEAYCGLVAELGLTLEPSFPQLPGEDTCVLPTAA